MALKEVKPYGDSLNDGAVQVSFTLPLAAERRSKEVARELARKMGLSEPNVAHMEAIGSEFTFFIIYGFLKYSVDPEEVELLEPGLKEMGFEEVNQFIAERIGKRVRVIGACTGSDAHSAGLDAIMNMKGYAGEYGLERYPELEARNLGSQVPNEELIAEALAFKADAILISQVVTQRNVHLENLTEFVELLEVEGLREEFILVLGGPRISHQLAMEVGFDAGFGPGTYPQQVAAFIAQTLAQRKDVEEDG